MAIPVSQMGTVATYILGQKLRGRQRYPLVLMLEPLVRCNLACAGCGKIQYPAHILKSHLSVDQCLRAADECRAPIVSLAGGEPLMHPQIDRIAAGLVERRKYVYLCTNGLLLEEQLEHFKPSKYLSFSVHLDGLEAEHDESVRRHGTYQTACNAIRSAVARGFRVTTNTTLFDGADPARTRQFFDEMMQLGVEGMMLSPGYGYEKAPDQEHFLGRARTRKLFGQLFGQGVRGWRFNQSPLFLEYLTGGREYECTPWGNPTYTVFGWQKPCYLLQDGYASTFQELMDATEWRSYGRRSGNPSCQDCMVHSGFEASAVDEAFSSPRGMLAMVRALITGPRVPAPVAAADTRSRPTTDQAMAPTQGWVAAASPDSLRVAFTYRGMVTLTLDDDSTLEGYVANVGATDVDVWRKEQPQAERVPIARVRRVALSGRDPARVRPAPYLRLSPT